MSTVQFGLYLAGTDRSTAQLSRVIPKGCIPVDNMLYAAMNFPGITGIVYISLEPPVSPYHVLLLLAKWEAEYYLKRTCIPEDVYDYLCITKPPQISRLNFRRVMLRYFCTHLNLIINFNKIPKLHIYQLNTANVLHLPHYTCDLLYRAAWSHPDYDNCDIKCTLESNNNRLISNWDGYFDEPLPIVALYYSDITLTFTHAQSGDSIHGMYICLRSIHLRNDKRRRIMTCDYSIKLKYNRPCICTHGMIGPLRDNDLPDITHVLHGES